MAQSLTQTLQSVNATASSKAAMSEQGQQIRNNQATLLKNAQQQSAQAQQYVAQYRDQILANNRNTQSRLAAGQTGGSALYNQQGVQNQLSGQLASTQINYGQFTDQVRNQNDSYNTQMGQLTNSFRADAAADQYAQETQEQRANLQKYSTASKAISGTSIALSAILTALAPVTFGISEAVNVGVQTVMGAAVGALDAKSMGGGAGAMAGAGIASGLVSGALSAIPGLGGISNTAGKAAVSAAETGVKAGAKTGLEAAAEKGTQASISAAEKASAQSIASEGRAVGAAESASGYSFTKAADSQSPWLSQANKIENDVSPELKGIFKGDAKNLGKLPKGALDSIEQGSADTIKNFIDSPEVAQQLSQKGLVEGTQAYQDELGKLVQEKLKDSSFLNQVRQSGINNLRQEVSKNPQGFVKNLWDKITLNERNPKLGFSAYNKVYGRTGMVGRTLKYGAAGTITGAAGLAANSVIGNRIGMTASNDLKDRWNNVFTSIGRPDVAQRLGL